MMKLFRTFLLGLMVAHAASAAPPEVVRFHGAIGELGGQPVPDGNYLFLAEIFAEASGGTAVYTQSVTASVSAGAYTVVLSPTTPGELNAAFADSPRFLQITVVSGPGGSINQTLLPRQEIGSVPFAVAADHADTADHATTADQATSADYAVTAGAACYQHWGGDDCATAAGFTAVVKGRIGGLESYGFDGGDARTGLVCVSEDAEVLNSWPGTYSNKLHRPIVGFENQVDEVDGICATCCTGGCYTGFGTSTCADGWAPVYVGRAGGIEGHVGPDYWGETLCVEEAAPVAGGPWSNTKMRLMRFGPARGGVPNGMDSVRQDCVVCCR